MNNRFLPAVLLLGLLFPLSCERDPVTDSAEPIMDTLRENHIQYENNGTKSLNQLPDPTRVTLNGTYTASGAIETLTKQTGFNLALNESMDEANASFSLQNELFWKAVLQIRNEFGLFLNPTGNVLLFEEGMARRSPVHVLGPLMISRVVDLSDGSPVYRYIQQLQSEHNNVRNRAHQKLQEITEKSWDDEFTRWNTWYREKGQSSYPPTKPRYPNRIRIEAWLEPKQSMPWVQHPMFKLTTSNKTIDDKLMVETYLSSSDRFGWQYTPPASQVSGKKLKGEGTFFYSSYKKNLPLQLQVQPDQKQSSTTTPSFDLTFTKEENTQDKLYGTLTIKRTVAKTEKQKEAVETVRKKRNSKKLVYIDEARMDRYLKWQRNIRFRLNDLRIKSFDTNQSIRITGLPDETFPSRSWDVTIPLKNKQQPVTLIMKLGTDLKVTEIPFTLDPLYVYSPGDRRF